MESWGCEFVEENSYRAEPEVVESDIIQLDMELLHQIVDRRYLKEISIKDRLQVQALTVSIAKYGILRPGKIIYDSKTIRLQDGNHRYLAAKALELDKFPVTVVRATNIQAPGATLEFAVQYLLRP